MPVSLYADVEFYLNDYGRKANEVIPTERFKYYAQKASAEIDRYTFRRIKECTEQISMCCCELAELLYSNEAEQGNPLISSESVGGYSVSYADLESARKAAAKDKREILKRWLSNELLYRG